MKINLRTIGAILLGCLFSGHLSAQIMTRSGHTAQMQNLRKFPCGGIEIFEENFSGTEIPVGWTVLDVDGQQPTAEIANGPVGASPGWHVRSDFTDFRNRLLVSPSWYEDTTVASDDWLITPLITLGNNTCLSWRAYSQDPFFPESYEIRISLGTPTADSAGFLNIPPLLEVAEEDNEAVYRSVNLAAYAGQDVYLAIRHTSKDKFVLALDDIRLADVEMIDLSPFAIEIPENPQTNDIIEVKGAVRNVGSDTLTIDSTLMVHYSVDGDSIAGIILRDSITLAPNDSVQFVQDSTWSPNRDKVYRVCIWITGGDDMNAANDSSCAWIGIGRFVGLEDELDARKLQVYPNPVEDQLTLQLSEHEALSELRVSLVDLHARELLRTNYMPAGNKNLSLSLANIPTGVYILRLTQKGRLVGRVRVVKK